MPGTHTQTLCVCSEMPLTPLTPHSQGFQSLGGFSPGVVKRFSSAEETKTEPVTVEDVANTDTAGQRRTWIGLLRCFLMGVIYALAAVLLLKVAPEWAMDTVK